MCTTTQNGENCDSQFEDLRDFCDECYKEHMER